MHTFILITKCILHNFGFLSANIVLDWNIRLIIFYFLLLMGNLSALQVQHVPTNYLQTLCT